MTRNLSHISEESLLELFYKEKDERYIGELLCRYTLRLIGVGMKYLKNEEDAKDMVQQVYEKALLEIGKYPITNFGGWLYRIAQNHCISILRSRKILHEEELLKFVTAEPPIETSFFIEKEKQDEQLTKALMLLKEEQKLCIELFFFQKKSYQEISEICSYDMKNVKSHIQNGKRNLRLIIEQLEKEEYAKK
ncbi:MAG TPA: sigma-70 family RNA polymerase sigma factor [Edaphocola sp.]|nr:sigma-70 family RNA polymerase sigma factor [Edaphocola sp.]